MKKLIHLTDDLAILPHHISVVKRSGLDPEDSCIVYMTGQGSTSDGFLVDLPMEQVVAEVNEALMQEVVDRLKLETKAGVKLAERIEAKKQ
jgi:hypothetical protein